MRKTCYSVAEHLLTNPNKLNTLENCEKYHHIQLAFSPSSIDDKIHLDKEKSKTDAEYYRIAKQAEANKLLLTPQFLELRRYEAMSANQKVRLLELIGKSKPLGDTYCNVGNVILLTYSGYLTSS